jgi:hypothetical protein
MGRSHVKEEREERKRSGETDGMDNKWWHRKVMVRERTREVREAEDLR